MLAAALTVLVGASILTLPYARSWISSLHHREEISTYLMSVPPDALESYAHAVSANEQGTLAEAMSALSVSGTETIGRIVVEDVGIDLPIFPTSTDSDLVRGAGHLETSDAPVGGRGTHSALTAHTGMPSAEMFDHLPKLDRGGLIQVFILGQQLSYRVIEKRVDTPEEGGKHLARRPGEDLLTLITCTPYGVNSHRLLVTAERVENESGVSSPVSIPVSPPQAKFPSWLPLYLGFSVSLVVGAHLVRKRI